MGVVFRRKFKGADGTVRQCETWTARFYRAGKRVEVSTDTTKKGEAVALLKTLEGKVAGGAPVSASAHRLTVDDAMDAVFADYQTNGKATADDVERRWTMYLQPAFGGRKVSSITTADIRDYTKTRLDDGAKPATVNRELSALRRAFSLAVKDGRSLYRPYVPMLREDNIRTGFFDRAQVDAVTTHLPEHLRPVITFAYLTGWRVPSEVLTLTWGQVDLKAGTVRLEPGTTKNDAGRTFIFDAMPALKTLLTDQRAVTDATQKRLGRIVPHVFHHEGEPIRDLRWAWEKACKAAGCPGRLVHDLRRTAVRNLVRSGVSEHTAMKLTGHKTRSVFDRYDIVSEADLRDAGRKLAEHAATGTGR
jgi:integrase